jgi:hypothetical protein
MNKTTEMVFIKRGVSDEVRMRFIWENLYTPSNKLVPYSKGSSN